MSLSTDTREAIEHFNMLTKAKAFLGREFLTWLWYLSEESPQKKITTHDGQTLQVRLWVDDRLGFESTGTDGQSALIKGGAPADSPEASLALRTGKVPRDIKVGFDVDRYGVFTATLNADGVSADSLAPKALQLPDLSDLDEAPEDGELELARIQQVDVFYSVFDGLFREFITLRSGKNWQKAGLEKIRAWIENRRLAESPTLH